MRPAKFPRVGPVAKALGAAAVLHGAGLYLMSGLDARARDSSLAPALLSVAFEPEASPPLPEVSGSHLQSAEPSLEPSSPRSPRVVASVLERTNPASAADAPSNVKDSSELSDVAFLTADHAALRAAHSAVGVSFAPLGARSTALRSSVASSGSSFASVTPVRKPRLQSPAHLCSDLLQVRHFQGQSSALVRVAVSPSGAASWRGLAESAPAAPEQERAFAACVSRLHFAPAVDESGQAVASVAVLRLRAGS